MLHAINVHLTELADPNGSREFKTLLGMTDVLYIAASVGEVHINIMGH